MCAQTFLFLTNYWPMVYVQVGMYMFVLVGVIVIIIVALPIKNDCVGARILGENYGH